MPTDSSRSTCGSRNSPTAAPATPRSSCAAIEQSLKKYKLDAKDSRGLAKWYADIVDKESGIDLGGDLKLWGELSLEKKEVSLFLKGRF